MWMHDPPLKLFFLPLLVRFFLAISLRFLPRELPQLRESKEFHPDYLLHQAGLHRPRASRVRGPVQDYPQAVTCIARVARPLPVPSALPLNCKRGILCTTVLSCFCFLRPCLPRL